MQSSKLVFSETELQLAQNREVILTKMAVIEKVYEQFGVLGESVFEFFKTNQTGYFEELSILPKISRGENYCGFPWVMLDYPRYFNAEVGHFALRTFFWWGHYYLIQLQVSNRYAQNVLNQLIDGNFPNEMQNLPVWAGFPSNPWDYQIPQTGLSELRFGQPGKPKTANSILKIAIPVPINQSYKLKEIALDLCARV